jgi:hypothetical protein
MPAVAEAVIGHVPPGIIGTYDLWQYASEKRDALTRWSDHVTALVAA